VSTASAGSSLEGRACEVYELGIALSVTLVGTLRRTRSKADIRD
jgi:hypothetical protein